MRKPISQLLKLAALAAPLAVGAVGFSLDGQTFLNALFNSVCLYTLNVQDAPPNIWVELARWSAPLATAGGILMTMRTIRERFLVWLRSRRGDSVAVYGPEQETAPLLAQLDRRGIDGGDRFVRARQYILLNGEEENFAFYTRHRDAMDQSDVYLKCAALPAQSVSPANLHLFCPEENSARLFWARYPLYERSARHRHRLRIAFLGFGPLGEHLLAYALQNNIFSPEQSIEYHIFGDGKRFAATHAQLDQISDPVVFHDEPWYDAIPLLETAHMAVVLTQEDQLRLLGELLLAASSAQFHVFASECSGLELLDGQHRLTLFHWRQEAQSLEHILGDRLFRRAKRINLRYAHLYENVPETDQAMEETWRQLDSFTRCSNISAADYHGVRLTMLAALGEPADPAALSPERLELLSHLEHIRWCRYHYLNNWRLGTPENGARKDPARRIHTDLIPYQSLSEDAKEKDRENIRLLLSLE